MANSLEIEARLINSLRKLLPDITFQPGKAFSWSPAHTTVTYCPSTNAKASVWALLHEAGHATLRHKTYKDDVDLLQKELAAWHKAKELAEEHAIKIDENHIQDCLDTYRDWLHQRSTCPRCGTVSLQASSCDYICHNCNASWQVSTSRMCRPYRLSKAQNKKPPKAKPQTTFS